ncbi:hypothetical protein ASF23_04615 [Curtobacterium sp. Leaf261]|nr:hypothetical protein ASF23_04615 [Curtobacterium sp. Leaf261]
MTADTVRIEVEPAPVIDPVAIHAPIRVLSVPSGHPYVQHLSVDAGDPAVERLADVPPVGAAPGQWWPPVVFDPEWLRTHADDFDLVHLHFGLESFPPEHVERVVETLAALRKPLVYTVHDLTNPQLTDQEPHLAQVRRLVVAADALITLTDAAAAETEDRWGRRPTTIPHPNVLPLDGPAPVGAPSERIVVGMHLRDLRPNIDAVVATRTLLAAVALLRARGADVVGRIHLNDRVRDPETAARVADLVGRSSSDVQDADLELVRGPRLSDADLARSIADLDVALLPYGHGTHSGWVELCFDLGVPVVGPRVGHAADQHPGSFRSFDRGDAESLAAAITEATAMGASTSATTATVQAQTAARPGSPARAGSSTRPGSPARADRIAARRAERRVERRAIQAAHRAVYAAAMATA